MTAAPDSPLATLWCPSPNHGSRRGEGQPNLLLMHYTGMETAEGALDWLTRTESGVSAHYLVDEAGRIAQIVAESERAWHAGHAHWAGEDDINSCSIGIEIHNPGHEFGYPDFPEAQMLAVEALSVDILERNRIPRQRVLAHSDVSPARKRDPGEKFDWCRLARAGVGSWVEPVPIGKDDGFGPGDGGEDIKNLQLALAAFGYAIEASGAYDERTEQVVTAFQRHFRPIRVDGRADCSTIATLKALNKLD